MSSVQKSIGSRSFGAIIDYRAIIVRMVTYFSSVPVDSSAEPSSSSESSCSLEEDESDESPVEEEPFSLSLEASLYEKKIGNRI